jgi:hypothetical protein
VISLNKNFFRTPSESAGGYICATANSITGWCRIENIFAMTNAVKKYGNYPLAL